MEASQERNQTQKRGNKMEITTFDYTKSVAGFESEVEFFRAIVQKFVDRYSEYVKDFRGSVSCFVSEVTEEFVCPDKDTIRRFKDDEQYKRFATHAAAYYYEKV